MKEKKSASELEAAPANSDAEAEELARLVAAVRALEIIKSNDPAWKRAPAVRVIDCVLSLNRNYDRFLVPRLNGFEKNRPNVKSVRDLRDLIKEFPSPHDFIKQELRYNDEARARTLDEVVKWLNELPSLEEWARTAQPSGFKELHIRGFGLAGFQYMRMLFGADTTKPDKWIIRFVSQHVGRSVSDSQALHLLERAAEALKLSVRDVDTTIWEMLAREDDRGAEFETGNTVTLKSGGHLMTVVSIDPKGGVTCAWSVKDDVKTKEFPSTAIIRASKPLTLEELIAQSYNPND